MTRGLPSSVIRTRAVSRNPLEVAAAAREAVGCGVDCVSSDDMFRWLVNRRISSLPLLPLPPPPRIRFSDDDEAVHSRTASTTARRERIRKREKEEKREAEEEKRRESRNVFFRFRFFVFSSRKLSLLPSFLSFFPTSRARWRGRG